MSNIIKKALKLIIADDPVAPLLKISKRDRPCQDLTERELIELESKIGSEIFGVCPQEVVRREFFNLDPNTWIWHEEVSQPDGQVEELTTRYEIQDRGILKVQPGPRYTYLDGQELYNFVVATREYYERVSNRLYRRDPRTGQSL